MFQILSISRKSPLNAPSPNIFRFSQFPSDYLNILRFSQYSQILPIFPDCPNILRFPPIFSDSPNIPRFPPIFSDSPNIPRLTQYSQILPSSSDPQILAIFLRLTPPPSNKKNSLFGPSPLYSRICLV